MWLRAQASPRDIKAQTGINLVGAYPTSSPALEARDDRKSDKTIGIDIHPDPYRARPFQLLQPFAHDILEVDRPQRMD